MDNIFQFVLIHIALSCLIADLVAENSTTNESAHSISPLSHSASSMSLIITSSNATRNQTPSLSTQSQQFNTQLTTSIFTSSALGPVLPTLSQFGNHTIASTSMAVFSSQAAPSVPVRRKPEYKRQRTAEDVYATAVLLTISGVCSIMLLALFVKFLLDSRKR